MNNDIREIDEALDLDNNDCIANAPFIPTPDEIQQACVEILNSWTDDIRDSRRVLSMRWLGRDSQMECIRDECARGNGSDSVNAPPLSITSTKLLPQHRMFQPLKHLKRPSLKGS